MDWALEGAIFSRWYTQAFIERDSTATDDFCDNMFEVKMDE